MDERFLGVDIGGTSIKWTVLRGRRIENRGQLPTPRVDHHAVLRVVAELSRGVGGQLCGIGVAVPGTVDPVRRRSIFVPNLPGDWADLHVAEELEGITGLPVVLINDARAFAWAEHTSGAARGVANALFITLGTGVGGAIAFRGEILVGDIDAIGEVGHVPVDPDGYLCACVSVCTDEAWDEVPLTRRPSTADEVAAAVRWLVGCSSVQTTGAVIPVDGGWLLR